MQSKKTMNTSGKSLAQSVGFGILQEGGLGGMARSLNTQGGILNQLADHANLPDELDGGDQKEKWNLKNFCELCDRTFGKLKGVSRHHCRKCNRSVCQ